MADTPPASAESTQADQHPAGDASAAIVEDAAQDAGNTALPPLNEDNWADIVQALTSELGATVWAAQHAAYITTENRHIVLAFHPGADKYLQVARLSELGQVLARHYGTEAQLKTVPWQEGYRSAHQHKQQRVQAAQQQALAILHNDPQAQRIQQLFGGQWQPDSVELLN